MKIKNIILLIITIILLLSTAVSCAQKEEKHSNLGLIHNNYIEYDGWIYYSEFESGDLYKIKPNGEEKNRVGDIKTWSFSIYEDRIYYISGYLYSAKLDGSDIKKIMSSDQDETAVKYNDIRGAWMQVADGWIYYIDEKRKINRVQIDASESEIISEEGKSSLFLSIDEDKVYCISQTYGEINTSLCYINNDGTSRITIGENELGLAIDYDDNYVYYDDPDGEGIYKISFDESQKQKLTDNSSDGSTFKVIGDWIYYFNNEEDSGVYKVKTDGSEDIKVTDDKYIMFMLDVWDNWLFYTGVHELGVQDEQYIGMLRVGNSYKTDRLIEKIIDDMELETEIRKYE